MSVVDSDLSLIVIILGYFLFLSSFSSSFPQLKLPFSKIKAYYSSLLIEKGLDISINLVSISSVSK